MPVHTQSIDGDGSISSCNCNVKIKSLEFFSQYAQCAPSLKNNVRCFSYNNKQHIGYINSLSVELSSTSFGFTFSISFIRGNFFPTLDMSCSSFCSVVAFCPMVFCSIELKQKMSSFLFKCHVKVYSQTNVRSSSKCSENIISVNFFPFVNKNSLNTIDLHISQIPN